MFPLPSPPQPFTATLGITCCFCDTSITGLPYSKSLLFRIVHALSSMLSTMCCVQPAHRTSTPSVAWSPQSGNSLECVYHNPPRSTGLVASGPCTDRTCMCKCVFTLVPMAVPQMTLSSNLHARDLSNPSGYPNPCPNHCHSLQQKEVLRRLHYGI